MKHGENAVNDAVNANQYSGETETPQHGENDAVIGKRVFSFTAKDKSDFTVEQLRKNLSNEKNKLKNALGAGRDTLNILTRMEGYISELYGRNDNASVSFWQDLKNIKNSLQSEHPAFVFLDNLIQNNEVFGKLEINDPDGRLQIPD